VSKMFETLYRLERGFSRTDAPPEPAPVPVRSDAADSAVPARSFAVPARIESKTPPPRATLETRPAWPLTMSKRILAKAVDLGILGLSLGLLWSVIRLAGCDLHLSTRDFPLVLMSGILLATFYWFLWVLAQRETPGTSLVSSGRIDSQGQLVSAQGRPRQQALAAPQVAAPLPAARTIASRETVKSGPVEDVTVALRILANERILDARTYVSLRNLRDHERYFLGRWAASGAEVTECVQGRDAAGESSLHGDIYRTHPSVMAVVHWHAPEIAPFGITTVRLQPVSGAAMFLSEGVPVLELHNGVHPEGVEKLESAPESAISAALGNSPAVLVRGRGAIVVAESLKAAVARAIHMTLNAKSQAQAILMGGTVNYLASEEALDLEYGDTEDREWEIWKQRLPKT
jgi:ribulose-5-phosphate 4-epimerase/fuculose-1-phosphate aldolase